MNYNKLKKLDTSLKSFQWIKEESEKLWQNHRSKGQYWDSTIQDGTKWKKGLTEDELLTFEKEMGFEFPESLKNYYRTMNGVDKQGMYVDEFTGETVIHPAFYSYPDNIDVIKKQIGYVMEDNNVSEADKAPNIFPSHSHRFLILDEHEPVLSMVGLDIICWADNLAKSIAKDIFYIPDKVHISSYNPQPSFWTERILK